MIEQNMIEQNMIEQNMIEQNTEGSRNEDHIAKLKKINEKEETTECEICDEKYNKSTRKKVECRECSTEVCKTCTRTYLLGSIKDAHCMTCQGLWDRGFLVDTLNNSFVTKTYTEHRKHVLLQRETARFPETMPLVEELKKDQVIRNKANKLKEERKKLHTLENRKFSLSLKNEDTSDYDTQIQMQETVVERLALSLERLSKELQKDDVLVTKKKDRKVKFIHACPAEGCKGFLSTAWKCGLCDQWTCPTCFELKGEKKDDEENPHVCKKENIASAELIKKDTKKCPQCAVPIFKISGCDQIFCVECHIAFSWRTGEIETGIIHNPHFFQWQRTLDQGDINAQHNMDNLANRNPCDPCNENNIPGWYVFRQNLKNSLDNQLIIQADYDWAEGLYRQVGHLEHITQPIRNELRRIQDNEQLRANYLIDEITEQQLQDSLVSKEKKAQKQIACLQLYDLMLIVFRESLNKIYGDRLVSDSRTQVLNLVKYTNKELARISYVYSLGVQLYDYNSAVFTACKFSKSSYQAFKDDNLRHTKHNHPLRKMGAVPKNKKVKTCQLCKSNLGKPFYQCSWECPSGFTICSNCYKSKNNNLK